MIIKIVKSGIYGFYYVKNDGVKIINHTVKRLQRFYVIEDDEQEHIFTK